VNKDKTSEEIRRELARQRRAKQQREASDGRPRTCEFNDDYDPLLEALKQHHGETAS
jgi:hypothetical protein